MGLILRGKNERRIPGEDGKKKKKAKTATQIKKNSTKEISSPKKILFSTRDKTSEWITACSRPFHSKKCWKAQRNPTMVFDVCVYCPAFIASEEAKEAKPIIEIDGTPIYADPAVSTSNHFISKQSHR